MASPVPARLAAAPSPSARRSPRCSPPPRWRRRWCAGRPSPGVWKPGAKRGAKMVMSNQGKLGCFVCGIAAYLDVLVDVYLFELDWIGLISCMFKYRHTLTRLKLHWKAWKATRRKWHSFDSLNCSKKCVLVEHGYQHILTHLHISVYM